MFKNYLSVAFRNIMSNKLYSLINISGLAIGLAAFILILLFVRDETTWDQHWGRGADTYRLETTWTYHHGEDRLLQSAVDPLKDIFLETFPEVEDVTRYLPASVTLRAGDQLIGQSSMFVDDNFIDFFGFRFIEGSNETALSGANNIVISERTAQRLFGTKSVLGKVVSIRSKGIFRDFVVGGVIEDPKQNSAIQHDFLVPFKREYFEGARWFTEDWHFNYRDMYIRFKPGTNVDALRGMLPQLIEQHRPKQSDGFEDGPGMKLHLVSLADLHLKSHGATGDIDALYGFLAIAFLILLIAIANFLNLSMARTTHRAREVAMRKVLGAQRSQIIQQFLSESVVTAFLALTVALVLVEVSLPYYNLFLTAFIKLDISNISVIAVGILLALSVGLASGSFQALYFAVLKPRDVLYSSISSDNGTKGLRVGLVVAQFAISVGLMTAAVFVARQTEYIRTLDLGFDPSGLVVIAGTSGPSSDVFKQRLLSSPLILAVGRSSDVPTEGSEDRLTMRSAIDDQLVTLDGLPTGPGFFDAYKIPLIAGRQLTLAESDVLRTRAGGGAYKKAANIVVNRSGAELLGFTRPEDAINQTVPTNLNKDLILEATIVGVVDDFHFDSVRNSIRPGIYYLDERRQADMSVRFDPSSRSAALKHMQQVWQETFPNAIFRYRDMKDLVDAQYKTDTSLGDMLAVFTFLAITISCMGLYGLASFTVERRTKEIGLRKVMGAKLTDIIVLLLWQFSKPILLANLLACPIAYYFINAWLNGFVYRIELNVLPFMVTGAAALLIGWMTVVGRAWWVAGRSPIQALRYE
jgi:putative ABC transport system permease protein